MHKASFNFYGRALDAYLSSVLREDANLKCFFL